MTATNNTAIVTSSDEIAIPPYAAVGSFPGHHPLIQAGFTQDQVKEFYDWRQEGRKSLLIASGPTGNGLTTTLRMTSDIILAYNSVVISEIRDKKSAELAISAAADFKTMGAMHGENAMSIPGRLAGMGIDRRDALSPHVMGLWVSQRVATKLCPHCSISYEEAVKTGKRSETEYKIIENIIPEEHLHRIRILNSGSTLSQNGCGNDGCRYGATGRDLIAEVIKPDGRFLSLLRDNETKGATTYWLNQLGGMLIAEHAALKVAFGIIDPRHLLGVLENSRPLQKERILHLLKTKGEKWFGSDA